MIQFSVNISGNLGFNFLAVRLIDCGLNYIPILSTSLQLTFLQLYFKTSTSNTLFY